MEKVNHYKNLKNLLGEVFSARQKIYMNNDKYIGEEVSDKIGPYESVEDSYWWVYSSYGEALFSVVATPEEQEKKIHEMASQKAKELCRISGFHVDDNGYNSLYQSYYEREISQLTIGQYYGTTPYRKENENRVTLQSSDGGIKFNIYKEKNNHVKNPYENEYETALGKLSQKITPWGKKKAKDNLEQLEKKYNDWNDNHFRKTREVEVIELDISGKDKSLEFSLKSIDNYLGSNMSEAIEQTDAKFTPDGKATDISKQTKREYNVDKILNDKQNPNANSEIKQSDWNSMEIHSKNGTDVSYVEKEGKTIYPNKKGKPVIKFEGQCKKGNDESVSLEMKNRCEPFIFHNKTTQIEPQITKNDIVKDLIDDYNRKLEQSTESVQNVEKTEKPELHSFIKEKNDNTKPNMSSETQERDIYAESERKRNEVERKLRDIYAESERKLKNPYIEAGDNQSNVIYVKPDYGYNPKKKKNINDPEQRKVVPIPTIITPEQRKVVPIPTIITPEQHETVLYAMPEKEGKPEVVKITESEIEKVKKDPKNKDEFYVIPSSIETTPPKSKSNKTRNTDGELTK